MTLFFHLLQCGLWNKSADPLLFEGISARDWNQIYQYAVRQALIGIIYDAMSTLPSHLQPDRSLRLKWFMTVQKIEQNNQLLNRVLGAFSQEMERCNVRFFLLKGQGQASFYPNPLRRQSGDIDLYFPAPADYSKACAWIAEQGLTVAESVKHISVEWQGAHLEFHDGLSEMHRPLSNRRLQDHMAQCMAERNYEALQIDKIHVQGLSPEVNLMYMMLHIFSHLITGGIGLRQFCDWALYASYHAHQINRERLGLLIDQTGLRRFANAFAQIQVEYLGLRPSQVPYDYVADAMSEWLFEDIMAGGNFGNYHHSGVRPAGKWLGKWHTAQKVMKRAVRFFRLSPSETVWLPIHYVIRNVQLLRNTPRI
ncbi:MAG: nucleotidyltransferase family protein [Bacteroidales bacterium]